MKIIRCLSEKIEDELHDASEYIELAMIWKGEYPDVAELFYELSKEEMESIAAPLLAKGWNVQISA